ncbi:MAG: hypothetical protein FWD68_10390 [Alphaproteobacteria bacterium]|nr:hypothetical protein [Alphaproteobacteria bacterium]
MCFLCNNENAYRAYMNYVEARRRKGQTFSDEEAVNAVLDEMEAAAREANARAGNDDPASDKTLSPFFCSPINR